MVTHGFDMNSYDFCVYHSMFDDGSMIYLLLYVDDVLVATKKKNDIATLKELLSSEFDMKDLGPARKILGLDLDSEKLHRKDFYLDLE